MSLETTRIELQKAKKRLERYQAVLRLANNEIEQRNRNIIALTTFAYQAGRITKFSPLLRLILVQALETTGAPVGAVILFDSETKALSLGVHRGLSPGLVQILTGQELEQGAAALMPHLVAGDGALLEYNAIDDPNEQALLATGRLSSLVSLPLHIGTNLIGTLLVGLQEKRLFKPSELCFLMSLTQEAAIILDSLRLRDELWQTAESLLGEESTDSRLEAVESDGLELDIAPPFGLPPTGPTVPEPGATDLEQLLAAMMEAEDEVQQQNADLQTLNTIAERMNQTLKLKEILDSAVTQTRQTLEIDAAWIYLRNDREHLELQTYTGLSQAYVRGMHSLPLSNSLEGQVAIENKAVYIENLSADTRSHKIWVDKEGLQALALVPLPTPNTKGNPADPHIIGVLAVGLHNRPESAPDPKEDTWTPRRVRLLSSIANQMALAINNARLYAQLQDKEVNVRTGNEVLQTVNDMLLEKNVYLERFIEEGLTTSLSQISDFFQQLLPKVSPVLSEADQQDLTAMKEIISTLRQQVQEADAISLILNNEFDRILEEKSKKTDYGGSTKPLRLGKVSPNSPPNPENSGKEPVPGREMPSPPEKREKESATSKETASRSVSLSFEEAINAGLVPPHILSREENQEKEEST